MPYTSAQELPFNRTSLAGHFQLASPRNDPGGNGCWLVLCGDEMLVTGPERSPQLPQEVGDLGAGIFFGYWRGLPCRLVAVPQLPLSPGTSRAESLVASESPLPIELLSLGGLGKMVLRWETHSRYCPACGAGLSLGEGDWGRMCVACATRYYPPIAPCAIVMVRRPGEVLLVRRPEYAPQRYGLVAGFVECGECLEETAVREVAEETGLKVANLRYVGSQCWPFPNQLMCGFVADYADGEITVQTRELVDARWFPVDALPTLPPRRSLARYILDTELGRGE